MLGVALEGEVKVTHEVDVPSFSSYPLSADTFYTTYVQSFDHALTLWSYPTIRNWYKLISIMDTWSYYIPPPYVPLHNVAQKCNDLLLNDSNNNQSSFLLFSVLALHQTCTEAFSPSAISRPSLYSSRCNNSAIKLNTKNKKEESFLWGVRLCIRRGQC